MLLRCYMHLSLHLCKEIFPTNSLGSGFLQRGSESDKGERICLFVTLCDALVVSRFDYLRSCKEYMLVYVTYLWRASQRDGNCSSDMSHGSGTLDTATDWHPAI